MEAKKTDGETVCPKLEEYTADPELQVELVAEGWTRGVLKQMYDVLYPMVLNFDEMDEFREWLGDRDLEEIITDSLLDVQNNASELFEEKAAFFIRWKLHRMFIHETPYTRQDPPFTVTVNYETLNEYSFEFTIDETLHPEEQEWIEEHLPDGEVSLGAIDPDNSRE